MTNISDDEQPLQAVVVTDLDGTLLDHRTYSYAPAQPALDWIAEHNIPLILASSKTASEISSLQQELDITHPAIVENGGGVWIPPGYFSADSQTISPGTNYNTIMKTLADCPKELRQKFSGFCDWSTAEIAEKTGLTEAAAARAGNRSWSIPGVWHGDRHEYQSFVHYLTEHGLLVTQGGRFIHIMGNTSKGKMLSWLMELFQKKYIGSKVISIALGDAPNDRTMLEVADHAIVIPNLSGKILDLDPRQMKGTLLRAEHPGPAGWNSAVLPLLKKLE